MNWGCFSCNYTSTYWLPGTAEALNLINISRFLCTHSQSATLLIGTVRDIFMAYNCCTT